MSKRKRVWEYPEEVPTTEPSQSTFPMRQMVSDSSDDDRRLLSLDEALVSSAMVPSVQPSEARSSKEAIPNSARKFTACEGCRKQKIKCDMPNDEPPCTRCQRRSLPCMVTKIMQGPIETTKRSDHALRQDVANLYYTLDTVCRHLNLDVPRRLHIMDDPTAPVGNGSGGQSGDELDCEVSPPGSPSVVQAPIDTFLEVAKLTSPGSAEQAFTPKKHSSQQDMITKGIITAQVADRLLERYFNRLDHYLYGIASMYQDAHTARKASPILFAAICTVSALHEPDGDHTIYEACNREFRHLVARSLFDKRDLEYVRALCIASFWLSDAARILSSDAIRRAGDMRLHRFFKRAVNCEDGIGPTSSHLYQDLTPSKITDRVRLWYCLFVCDQHMSILYNRDAILRCDREITTEWELFLDRDECEENDVRILSQTSLLLIMAQVRDTLGANGEGRLPVSTHGQLMMFSRQMDKWFARFSAIFQPNPNIGDFPFKGLRLHYQFGKLNLGHHVFQGLHGAPVPDVFVSVAIMAHDAATTIFEMILSDEQLQKDLVGMPHYFHIMIAFAGHFLLEVCQKYYAQLSLDLHEDLGFINRVLMLFANMQCHHQHPIRRMTPGLSQKLFECAAKLNIKLHFNNSNSHQDNGVAGFDGSSHAAASAMQHPMSYPNIAENWQFTPTNMHSVDEMTLGSSGEFEFPNMSLNFMT